MEWTQLVAWIAWAWVGISVFFSVYGTFSVFGDTPENMPSTSIMASAWSLQAILGLMLIQTSGLTV